MSELWLKFLRGSKGSWFFQMSTSAEIIVSVVHKGLKYVWK